MDRYRLPDAKGYVSMARWLSKETEADRQQVRDEILGTTAADFKAFAEVWGQAGSQGLVKVLGSQSSIKKTLEDRPGWLKVLQVL
jgi:Zn-dependent M16 (insulinase) family peptidase